VRVPQVQAALAHPEGGEAPRELQGTLSLTLPGELRVTQVGSALGCSFRFVLEDLLGIRALPEIEAGLDPRERGQKLHEVLARFVKMADYTMPPAGEAEALMRKAAQEVLGPAAADVHWQAEWHRWFGDEHTPGLLPAWLDRERERLALGWRWLGVEVAFQGLARPGWPFTLRGRLDRLDFHPETGELVVWDYKTGNIPNGVQVFEKCQEFQLPGYLWAVREGHTPVALEEVNLFCAGFICLKSSREDHLQHQDFSGKKDRWAEVMETWEGDVRNLGELLLAGDLRPAPRPAPTRRDDGACRYCNFALMCGVSREPEDEEGEA
jgi:RecB family exonuclease